MGIPGVLKEIGKGERVALAKLAIEHLERNKRPLRVAIDAAIWNFQNQASQGGKNPALRTLFFRLLKLLALPIHPVFVYDGKNRPLTKRGRTVSRYGTNIENELAKQLLSHFKFPFHTAPGEAEAECAFLQRSGVVDAVMSQDVDAIMFGSSLTLRDWSKEGTRGNKTPTHVNVLDLAAIKRVSGLDPDGMILVAMLSGGDYDETGAPGFGPTLACEIARAEFGTDLLELVRNQDEQGLDEWRERLEYELTTNESGYFRRRHHKLQLPHTFPDRTVLGYYMNPATSTDLEVHKLERAWLRQWASDIDVVALRNYTADMLDWKWKSGARRFVRCFAQPFFQDRLTCGLIDPTRHSVDNISESRRHFTADGIVELRVAAIPADVTGLDIEAEDDNPEYTLERQVESDAEEAESGDALDQTTDPVVHLVSPSKRKRQPWSPYTEERWWIPQTLLRLGLPTVVEAWEQQQKETLSDPRKFITRKCAKPGKAAKAIDTNMQSGAMLNFLHKLPVQDETDVIGRAAFPKTTHQPHTSSTQKGETQTPTKSRVVATQVERLPPISRFFKKTKNDDDKNVTKTGIRLDLDETYASCDDIMIQVPVTQQTKDIKSRRVGATRERLTSLSQKGSKASSILVDGVSISPTKKAAINTIAQEGDELFHSELAESELDLSNVTRRSSRIRRTEVQKITEERNGGPTHQPKSIESFFRLRKALDQSDTMIKRDVPVTDSDTNPATYDQGSAAASLSSKVNTLSRASLPGTWKQVEIQRAKSERYARISHIDLSED